MPDNGCCDDDTEVHPCVTRGPYRLDNETEEAFANCLKIDQIKLAERCQRHRHQGTCYKNWRGPPNPKRCRFELDSKNVISETTIDPETGELMLHKLDSMVANFNSTMLQAI